MAMTDAVEIPDDWRERTPVRGYSPDQPMLTVTGNRIFLLVAAFEALGEPEAVRCFIRGNRVALIPADPEHPNAYSVHGTNSRSEFSGTWLKDELERDTKPEGRFPLERDGELWVVDFAPEGEDNGDPITDGGQAQPEFGDQVAFIDSNDNEYYGIVLEPLLDHESITVAVARTDPREEYIGAGWRVETGVFPHPDIGPKYTAPIHAFKPGWNA